MSKPKHFKPGMYALIYEYMKDIAKSYGYNLVLHGSMNRDLDLIAIPWADTCTFNLERDMIMEFNTYLGCKDPDLHYTILPGNRHGYTISFNRGDKRGEWVRFEDSEWYLDISVIPCKGDEGFVNTCPERIQGATQV